MDKVTIIVPAYNEQDNIRKVIDDVESAIPYDFRLLVIDDCSTDGTNAVCQGLKSKYKNLSIKRNPMNLGKTQSILNALFDDNDSDIVAFIDGDDQYFAEDLPIMISLAKSNDIVCGKRKGRHDSFYRRFASKCFNLFNRKMFNIKIDDVNCGMKAFRTEIFRKIHIKYTKARWFIDTEMLARAYKENMKIVQYEVNHKDRTRGISHVSAFKLGIETIRYGIKLKCEL
jgi:glycosyltransferase involved in cell wall biosynthesis